MKIQRIFSLIATGLAFIALFLPAVNISYQANFLSFNFFGVGSSQLGTIGSSSGLSTVGQSSGAWLVLALLIMIVSVAVWGWKEGRYDRSSRVLQGSLFVLVALSAIFVIIDVQVIRSFLSQGLSDLLGRLASMIGNSSLGDIPTGQLSLLNQIHVESGLGTYLMLLASLVGLVSIFLPSGSSETPQVIYSGNNSTIPAFSGPYQTQPEATSPQVPAGQGEHHD